MRLYRVGLFTDMYLPGPNGVATSVYLLLRELRRMGHEAWVIAPQDPEAPDHEEGVVRVRSVPYPFFEGTRLAFPSPRKLPTDFEITHTHTPLGMGLWGMQIARRHELPHVSTFHTNYEKYAHYIPGLAVLDKYTGIMRRLGRAFYNRAEVVIAPTHPVKLLAEDYGIERPIRVIPTGIDTEILISAPEPPSPWPSGKRRLLTVGRLGKEKSFEVVIEAFAHIRQFCDAHLVHVGEGPEKESLQRLARDLGVLEHITWVGAVPYREVGGYYRLAELFLFASETETQGLVLWEAQAVGVPVVAVGAGGTLEGVEEGKSGYLVLPQDARGMALRALELLRDEEKRLQFAQAARHFADRRSARRIAEEIVACYDEASEILRAEPQRLIFPFPRLPRIEI
ncbi:MAG: glycosyltransferase [Deinococcota bacterium]